MFKRLISLACLFVIVSSMLFFQGAPFWTGILDSSRAIDWRKAGVEGGVEAKQAARTAICTTLNPGVSTSQVATAIQNCANAHPSDAGGIVVLTAGNYNIGPNLPMKSNVTLRGAGSDNSGTIITSSDFSGNGIISIAGSNQWYGAPEIQPGGSNSATWTSGYAQGSTQIGLGGGFANGQLFVGKWVGLDQLDTTVAPPVGNFVVCSKKTPLEGACSLEGPNGSRGSFDGSGPRGQVQWVKITACSPNCNSGSTFTIAPAIYATNWNVSQSPGAWWASTQIQYAGIEELAIDSTNDTSQTIIPFFNAFNCWATGVRTINGKRDHYQLAMAAHNTIQNNYMYGTQGTQSQSYGIENYNSGDNLEANNISHRVTSPFMNQIATGDVHAFNLDILNFYCPGAGGTICNDTSAGTMGQTTWLHGSSITYTNWEGNMTPGFKGDMFHGTGGLQTAFRNQVLGWAPIVLHNRLGFDLGSYNRVYNLIGNVIGKDGFHIKYQTGGDGSIYEMGNGNSESGVTVPDDALVATTIMRWGNYSVVPQASDTPTNSGIRFVSTEVPSGIGVYANAVPSDTNLPASLAFNSQPSWWPSGKPWPLIGPDVTGGNVGVCSGGTYNGDVVTDSSQCGGGTKISAFGGHANSNPATDCYFKLGGLPDGTGPVLNFSSKFCYGNVVPVPTVPTIGGMFSKLNDWIWNKINQMMKG